MEHDDTDGHHLENAAVHSNRCPQGSIHLDEPCRVTPDLIDWTQECRLMLTKLTRHWCIKERKKVTLLFTVNNRRIGHTEHLYQPEWISSMGRQIARGERGAQAGWVVESVVQDSSAEGSLLGGYPPARQSQPGRCYCLVRHHYNYNSFSFFLLWR